MENETAATVQTLAVRQARINARLDRLPSWGLSPAAYLVLGACYMLAYYDIAVIGLALPKIASSLSLTGADEGLPITTNLIGYMVGAYLLGNIADAVGRRRALALVVSVLTVSAVLTALSWNIASLSAFRFLEGLGTGAYIALSATIIGEFAPAAKRGRYLARNIIWAAFGNVIPAVLAIGLLAGTGSAGWRILFGLAGLIVFTLFLLRDRFLPESPRWLAAHGEVTRAESIVTSMEDRVRNRTGRDLAPVAEVPAEASTSRFPTAELLRRPFIGRLAVVFAFWFVLYFAVYAFLSYETTLISKLGLSLPSAVLMTALGLTGAVLGSALQPLYIDRIERKHSVAIGVSTLVIGYVLLAAANGPVLITLGSFFTSAGIFTSVIPAYSYTAEVFPTRARASAIGIADGLGHGGGAVQPYLILPLLAAAGPRPVLWLLAAIALAALVIILTALRTNQRPLTELSR